MIVCFPYVGDSIGGSHLSSLVILRYLDRSRFDPLCLLHEKGPLSAYLDKIGQPYELLPIPEYAGAIPNLPGIAVAMIRSMPIIRRFMHQWQVDVVHTNDLRMHLTWGIATRLAGAHFIWHPRVILSRSPLWRILGHAASTILAPSASVYATLPSGARRKAVVIHDAVIHRPDLADRATARARLLVPLNISTDQPVIGYVGNMTRQKRPLVFLEAAALLSKRLGGKINFVLVGDDRGGELAVAKAFAQTAGIERHCHFVGFQQPVEPWLAACDIIMAPGDHDAFGRTVVEAMLCNTPVVASASGGHLELIDPGRTGVLAALDDPVAFADAAAELLENPIRRQSITEAAMADAHKWFDPKGHAERIADAYPPLGSLDSN